MRRASDSQNSVTGDLGDPKTARRSSDRETHGRGQFGIVIDHAAARRCKKTISTAATESTVQSPPLRRMNAQ